MIKIDIPAFPCKTHSLEDYAAFSFFNVDTDEVEFYLIGHNGVGDPCYIIDIRDSLVTHPWKTIEEFLSFNQIKYKGLVTYASPEDFNLTISPA